MSDIKIGDAIEYRRLSTAEHEQGWYRGICVGLTTTHIRLLQSRNELLSRHAGEAPLWNQIAWEEWLPISSKIASVVKI